MAAMGSFFRGLKRGAIDFSENIGIFLNLFLLTVVYFLGVGLVCLISKILGKKFLDLNIDKRGKTYWEKRSIIGEEETNFHRQF